MRKLIVILIIVLMSANANAQSATTNENYIACTSERYYEDMMAFVGAGDTASFEVYRAANKCLILKAGMTVTVIDRSLFGPTVIMYKGVKLWTVGDAITVNR